jgi:hypothetical protein
MMDEYLTALGGRKPVSESGPLLPPILRDFVDQPGAYTRQSDAYSKLICTAFHLDFLRASEAFARRSEKWALHFAVNDQVWDGDTAAEWWGTSWDYVAGKPGVGGLRANRLTPSQRMHREGIKVGFDPAFEGLSPHLDRSEDAVHSPHVVVEAKALMARIQGSVPNRRKELALFHRWVHEMSDSALAVAIVVINVSEPDAAFAVRDLAKLHVRDSVGEIGLDALLIVPTRRRGDDRELELPRSTQYDVGLAHLARLYVERHA